MAVWRPATRVQPPMLALVLALVLANVLYFAWSRGSLAAFGFLPASFTETEPHRLTRQIRPELLRIVKETAPVIEPLPEPIPETGSATQGDTGR